MNKTTFNLEPRDKQTLSALRKAKFIPANIYGDNFKSTAVQCLAKDFVKLWQKVGETGVVYLKLAGKEIPALIAEVQVDPVNDQVIHAAWHAISLKEKIQAMIPVEIVGEIDIAEAVLVKIKDEIEVEALPTDLPEKFEIDVSQLTEIGQSITIGDLKYDQEKVKLMLGEEDLTAPVVLVQEVKEEVVEEVEPAEPEIITEKKAEEEAGAEKPEAKEETSEEK